MRNAWYNLCRLTVDMTLISISFTRDDHSCTIKINDYFQSWQRWLKDYVFLMLTWPILWKPLRQRAVLRGQWNTLRRLFAFGMKKFRDSRVPDLNMRPLSSSHAKHFDPSLAFSDSYISFFQNSTWLFFLFIQQLSCPLRGAEITRKGKFDQLE